ncbi:hypothetical protein [Sulfurimonas sp.]
MDDLSDYNTILKLIDFDLLEKSLTAFSIEKKLLAIAQKELIYIFSTQTKKQINTIKTYDGIIATLYFIPHSEHILTTTKEGRVIVYNYKNSLYSARLYSSLKKYKTQLQTKIISVAFNRYLVALGNSNGIIHIINLNSYKIQDEIKYTNASISSLCFTHTNELIIADSQGEIYLHDLCKQKVHKTIHTNLTNIKQLIHITNSDFVICNTRRNTLTLLNLKKSKIISNNYLTFDKDISYLTLTNSINLLVVLNNREILYVKLQNEEDLNSLILHNMIFEAYKLVEQNPQLIETKEYQKLEKAYTIKYLNAVNALQNANIDKAHKIVDTCLSLKGKKEEINLLFKAYQHYPRFQTLCMEKKFAPAYALSDKFPPLKYSKEYKNMETTFKKIYRNAQKQILLSDQNKAKELLSPYLIVKSKKDSINLILKYNQEFLEFLEDIKQKNYAHIRVLVKKYPKFADIPTYKTLNNSIYNALDEIDRLINAAKITNAIKKINKLKYATQVTDKIEKLEKKVLAVENLLENYEENNFKRCYELIDEEPFILLNLQLTKMLEKHWNKLINKSEKYALYGNIKGIKATLNELIITKTRAKRVGQLLRTSFIVQINDLIVDKKFKSAQNFIYSYIDIFGIDKDFYRIIKSYENKSSHKLAIISEKQDRLPRDSWIENKLIIT